MKWLSLQRLAHTAQGVIQQSSALKILNFMHFLVNLLGKQVLGGLRAESLTALRAE